MKNLIGRIIAENEVNQCTATYQDNSFNNAEITVDKYLNSSVTDECLGFRKNYSKSTNPYEKELAEQALFYLTPPPTTTDVERLFSTAGDIVTDERNRLLPANTEKLLFCRENLPKVNFIY